MEARAGSKRKRISSLPPTPISSSAYLLPLPSGMINPLSHEPSTLHQLQVAGLSEKDELPSKLQPGFPHQPWRDPTSTKTLRRKRKPKRTPASDVESTAEAEVYLNPDTESEAEAKSSPALAASQRKSYAPERAALRPLANSIATFLSRGDVPSAKRAFGLLMRSRVSGKPVDIRRNHYWELGAEILMRERPSDEDEEEGHADAAPEHRLRKQQLYPLANVPKVRDYFENLITRFPHHLGARRAASALQFQPALFNYEIHQAHNRLAFALEDLEAEAESWEFADEADGPLSDPFAPASDVGSYSERGTPQFDQREDRLREARDAIRLEALEGMRELATRMDKILDNLPFSRSPELWRLRGVVSLYVADMLVPWRPRDQVDKEEGDMRSGAERDVARKHFTKAVELGCVLDAPTKRAVGLHGDESDEEEEEGDSRSTLLPTFSSLPIRDHRPSG